MAARCTALGLLIAALLALAAVAEAKWKSAGFSSPYVTSAVGVTFQRGTSKAWVAFTGCTPTSTVPCAPARTGGVYFYSSTLKQWVLKTPIPADSGDYIQVRVDATAANRCAAWINSLGVLQTKCWGCGVSSLNPDVHPANTKAALFALALGTNGCPLLAYTTRTDDKLTVAKYLRADPRPRWAALGTAPALVQTVTVVPALEVAADGTTVVAYSDSTAGGLLTVLKYASVGNTWGLLGGSAGVSRGPVSDIAIKVDAQTVYVTYYEGGEMGSTTFNLGTNAVAPLAPYPFPDPPFAHATAVSAEGKLYAAVVRRDGASDFITVMYYEENSGRRRRALQGADVEVVEEADVDASFLKSWFGLEVTAETAAKAATMRRRQLRGAANLGAALLPGAYPPPEGTLGLWIPVGSTLQLPACQGTLSLDVNTVTEAPIIGCVVVGSDKGSVQQWNGDLLG